MRYVVQVILCSMGNRSCVRTFITNRLAAKECLYELGTSS